MAAGQLRCLNPACGGYKISDTATRINTRTGRKFVGPGAYGLAWAIIALIVVGLLAAIMAPGNSNDGIPMLIAAVIGYIFGYTYHPHVGIGHHEYRRLICGYKWEWREDQPLPAQPTYAPSGVLQQGAKRLEWEQQQAAAYYHERQRRQRERP